MIPTNIQPSLMAIMTGFGMGWLYAGSIIYQYKVRTNQILFGAISTLRFLITALIFLYILRSCSFPFILVVSTFIITVAGLLILTKAQSDGSNRQP